MYSVYLQLLALIDIVCNCHCFIILCIIVTPYHRLIYLMHFYYAIVDIHLCYNVIHQPAD